VARAEDFADIEAARIDVRGGSILPGFVDAHTHLVESGLAECGFSIDVSGKGHAETQSVIADAARSRGTGEWLMVTGWDESRWDPATGLQRTELDRVAPGTAVIAVRVDGHVAVLSSAAMKRAALALRDDARHVDVATGEVRETAVDRVRALVLPDKATLQSALRAASTACHRLGITTVHVFPDRFEPRIVFDAAARLRLRIVIHPPASALGRLTADGARSGDGDEWARWGGLKLFADGSVGARSAAFSSPYVSGGRGELLYDLEAMSRQIRAADGKGWPTLIHAIGDRAIGQVLEAHRRVGTDPASGHRVEHYEFPTREQLEETRRLGVTACMQPNFIGNWAGTGRLYEQALGPERDRNCNPLRAVLDAGIPLVFGSDGMPLGPLYGVAAAVDAPHAAQRITLDEAVRAYTGGWSPASSASALAVGDPADLAVLDGPLDGSGLTDRRVAQTWVGGVGVALEAEGR